MDKTMSDLYDEYLLLAMRADKRLQRLEKYATRPGYEEILKASYARAIKDIESWSGKGHKRFKTKAPMIENKDGELVIDERALRAKVNDIKTFLRADTSTMRPGKDTRGFAIQEYDARAKTFNQRYNSNLTWKEISGYYSSATARKISKSIESSKTVAQALGEFKKLREVSKENKKAPPSRAQILRDMEAGKDIKLSDDKVLNEIMLRMVKNGISPRTIFKDK